MPDAPAKQLSPGSCNVGLDADFEDLEKKRRQRLKKDRKTALTPPLVLVNSNLAEDEENRQMLKFIQSRVGYSRPRSA